MSIPELLFISSLLLWLFTPLVYIICLKLGIEVHVTASNKADGKNEPDQAGAERSRPKGDSEDGTTETHPKH